MFLQFRSHPPFLVVIRSRTITAWFTVNLGRLWLPHMVERGRRPRSTLFLKAAKYYYGNERRFVDFSLIAIIDWAGNRTALYL